MDQLSLYFNSSRESYYGRNLKRFYMERKNPLIIDFLMQIETNAPILLERGKCCNIVVTGCALLLLLLTN